MPRLLLIGGSDSSGGAGVSADLKTCHDLACEASLAVTAVTAQSDRRHHHSYALPAKTLKSQLLSVSLDDIDAIKIGMLPNLESAGVVRDFLKDFPRNRIVLDPVFSSSSGGSLSTEEGVAALDHSLFPYVGLITPNLFEVTRLLSQVGIGDQSQEELALACIDLGIPAVLLKGGHFTGAKCTDLLALKSGRIFKFSRTRVAGGSEVRGTGCRLASAIACSLGMGKELPDSVRDACGYLAVYIASQLEG